MIFRLLLFLLLPLFVSLFIKIIYSKPKNNNTSLPKSYPLIGHLFAIYRHKGNEAIFRWMCSLVHSSPSSTFVIHRPFEKPRIITGHPANVEHILKTKFSIYEKGPIFKTNLKDFLGDGILNVDGEEWKLQRRIASHEFNTKSLRKFIETVVDSELSERLIPILKDAAKTQRVLDLQDILQRFTFDNICKIAFGYDPEYLLPSLPEAKFADAFDDAVMLSTLRFRIILPFIWKIQKFFDIGSEKKLKEAVSKVHEFSNSVVRRKKQDMSESSISESEDLLSRFLKSGYWEDKTVVDIIITFMLAGRDTTSAALTWFFWILHKNKVVEDEIVKEIQNIGKTRKQTDDSSNVFDEVKEMVYTHAAFCESMRLYPPVPMGTKQAASDDTLPDGTLVKKGMRIMFVPHAMGRSERIWGPDWEEYRPERWLKEVETDAGGTKWEFVPRDLYSYPVFQAGPRICIGKDMSFLQMKRVAAGVLAKFKVVPVAEEGFEPVYEPTLTAKMKGGFPVRIKERT
ncbi:cytochrome P450 94A2-like [Silene latifolia]|uniref:cytochrome P450 94A2-like n=1 Tax=Silene latifolia TaxID=37657 RepID=UPI003D770779